MQSNSQNIEQLLSNGLSPAIRQAMATLLEEINSAAVKAQEAGVPAGLIVGQLEFYKAALISEAFKNEVRT